VARSSSTEGGAAGAYGLAIESEARLPGLGAPSGATRRTRHRIVPAAAIAAPAGSLIGEAEGGRERIAYYRHGDGILIRGGRYGDHLVEAGGEQVLSAIGAADPDLWTGHVLGQALPLAASLRGLEIFHAGAVAGPGGVLALAGPSGAGKSALVDALVAAGAGFFTDDVLAVELAEGVPVAYPGPTLLRLRGGAGKSTTAVSGVRRRLPLLAFLRLAPEPDADAVELGPCPTERLLETTFDGITPTAERRLRLLEVAAAIAPVAHELRFPAGGEPGAVATAILARFPLAAAR
jgi:hypothetical protein